VPDPLSYSRNPGFVVRTIGTHTMLLPVEGRVPDGALTLLLDGPVALYVWESLAESLSASQLAERVASEFDVERQVAERDVATFLEQLLELGCASAS
jgi:hypothetical protein